jgi:hypothetical protein
MTQSGRDGIVWRTMRCTGNFSGQAQYVVNGNGLDFGMMFVMCEVQIDAQGPWKRVFGLMEL